MHIQPSSSNHCIASWIQSYGHFLLATPDVSSLTHEGESKYLRQVREPEKVSRKIHSRQYEREQKHLHTAALPQVGGGKDFKAPDWTFNEFYQIKTQ